jgi:hypothetical protein
MRADALRSTLESDDLTDAKLVAEGVATEVPGSADAPASVNLERVRILAANRATQMKVTQLTEQVGVDVKALLDKCTSLFKGGISDSINKAKNEFHVLANGVYEEAESAKKELTTIAIAMEKYVTITELRRDRTEGDEIYKALQKGKMKQLRALTTSFKKILTAQERVETMQNVAANAVVAPLELAPPIFTMLTVLMEKGHVNGSVSFYEAKAGVRAALLAPATGKDPMCLVSSMPSVKKKWKDLVTHLRTNKSGQSPAFDGTTIKKVVKALKGAFDPSLFSTLPVGTQEWAPLVYSPVMFGYANHFVQVGFPHMCCMEARMLFDGQETIIGLPYERLPGATLKEKRAMLFSAPMDVLASHISGFGGFAIAHDNTQIVVVPTGFVIITISTGCIGLRWSMSSDDADTNRVKLGLDKLITSFPEMGNASTGHSQWLAWLSSI